MIDLSEVFKDKTTNSKGKTDLISRSLLSNKITINVLVDFASTQKDPVKATCIEAIEVATQSKADIANDKAIDFVVSSLSEKAPRIKWESARVISNIIHLFPEKQKNIIPELLMNASHEGTVVRWSTAMAFSSILKTNSPESKRIISGLKVIAEKEEKNSIKKIYLTALKGK